MLVHRRSALLVVASFHFISNIHVPTNKSNKNATLMKKYVYLSTFGALFQRNFYGRSISPVDRRVSFYYIPNDLIWYLGIHPAGTSSRVGITVGMNTVGLELLYV